MFDELLLASGDLVDIYGQGTCQDDDERDDNSSSEATDPSDASQDRVPARVATRDASRSMFAGASTTARRTRSLTRDQRPPETISVAQTAPTMNNNLSVGLLQPHSGWPHKRSRAVPHVSEEEEGSDGTAGGMGQRERGLAII